MSRRNKKDFSETKPFKRTTFIKKRVWNPFWLFNIKGIFNGISLLTIGTFYFTWALIKEDMITYYSLIFLLPGIYVIVKSLKRKKIEEQKH